MKLGEALALRARQAQQMNDLRGRIKDAALYQEGDTPPEDAGELIDEYVQLSDDHGNLVAKIAKANHQTVLVDGGTLYDLIQEREMLIRERNIVQYAAKAAIPGRNEWRYGRNEIKYVTNLVIPELRTQEADLIQQIGELNAKIQATNWEVEL